eukprot:scaffold564_cov248-Pinguiococcus_pyrenoidosus.AAC.26
MTRTEGAPSRRILVLGQQNVVGSFEDDGDPSPGFPMAFESSVFHTAPKALDVDRDARMDVLTVNTNGRGSFLGLFPHLEDAADENSLRRYDFQVPKLKVLTNWVAQGSAPSGNTEAGLRFATDVSYFDRSPAAMETTAVPPRRKFVSKEEAVEADSAANADANPRRRRLLAVDEGEGGEGEGEGEEEGEEEEEGQGNADRGVRPEFTGRRLYGDDDGGNAAMDAEEYDDVEDGYLADDIYALHYMEDLGRYAYDQYYDDEIMAPEMYGYHEGELDFTAVDPHVLADPVLIDATGDGVEDILLAVSYFFDASLYEKKDGADPTVYMASALMLYDLMRRTWVWSLHLDLSIDGHQSAAEEDASIKAQIYGAPNVVDLDRDGSLEAVVGTTLGFLYVVDVATGFVRRGFPMQFGPIYAAIPAVHLGLPRGAEGEMSDVEDSEKHFNPDLHLIVADMNGNVAAVSPDAEYLWKQKLMGAVKLTPAVGDVDGDGKLDVVVLTYLESDETGLIYVLQGHDGALPVRSEYPIRVTTEFTTNPILVDLHVRTAGQVPAKAKAAEPGESKFDFGMAQGMGPAPVGGAGSGLHLVSAATDGHIYVIEASTACTNRLDVGEEVYADLLVTDVTGDKNLDLVASTVTGDVVVFNLGVPYHSTNAVEGSPRGGLNGYTYGQWQGIYLDNYEGCIDAIGAYAPITFTIVDVSDYEGSYRVQIAEQDSTLVADVTFDKAGAHTVLLALESPGKAFLRLTLLTDTGLRFQQDFCLAYNVSFFRPLKLFVLIPLLVASAASLLYRKNRLALL